MKVDVNDMTFSYGTHDVLKDINIALEEPGLICIVGPNCVRKSTLIKCINKICALSEGTVTIDGYDIRDVTHKELSKVVGYVPVVATDMFSMSVLDTVLMGRYPHQRMGSTSKLDLRIAMRSLRMMGIEDLAMSGFNELSAGQRQKVAIARGLAQTPRLLILDEPTSNLDVRHQIQVTELLHELAIKHGITVLMISHDLNISAKYADKVIMLAPPGVVYRIGDAKEVFTEEAIGAVYGVECRIIDDGGRPHIILGRPI